LLPLPLAAAVAVVLGLIYVNQLSLYKILTSLRDYLSLSGLVYPSIEMVYTAHGRNLLLPCYCGISNEFPHTYYSGSCLKCPDTPLELPQTAASWYRMDISGNSATEAQVKQQMKQLLGGFIETTHSTRCPGCLCVCQEPSRYTQYLFVICRSPGQFQEPLASIGSAVNVAAWMISNPKARLAG
jgi:hypothetical protein